MVLPTDAKRPAVAAGMPQSQHPRDGMVLPTDAKRPAVAAGMPENQPASRSVRPGSWWCLLVSVLALGCPPPATNPGDTASQSNYPPASLYEFDPEFAGEWTGDVDGLAGTLKIGLLDDRSFFGSFVTDDGATEYTLLLEHTYVETEEGGEAPSNRTTFTWQDGLGSRGKGWLLINREETALTGSFGFGLATSGLGQWSFERATL